MSDAIRFNVYMRADEHTALVGHANSTGKSSAKIIREAIKLNLRLVELGGGVMPEILIRSPNGETERLIFVD
jgi:hypothetical protein